MKFTIFTPTHNPEYLKRLDESIKLQTIQDFEWLIVPNGEFVQKSTEIESIVSCPQVRVLPYIGETSNIGEIKKFCCDNAKGEILVEVDHDDELVPCCLEKLADAFADETIDFAYSNCVEIKNGESFTYDGKFVYIVSQTANEITVYNSYTFEVVKRITASTPSAVSNVGLRIEELGL